MADDGACFLGRDEHLQSFCLRLSLAFRISEGGRKMNFGLGSEMETLCELVCHEYGSELLERINHR